MQITIRTHHVDITPSLKEYAKKKIEKLEKYFENIQEIIVELDVSATSDEDQRQVAFGIIKASQTTMRAEEATRDMYASIDLLTEKLEVQLRRHKEKLKDHKKSGSKRSVGAVAKSRNGHKGLTFLKDDKLYIPKPMTPEEALDILLVEKNKFLVFRNAKTEQVNVIYPIRGEQYGLIET